MCFCKSAFGAVQIKITNVFLLFMEAFGDFFSCVKIFNSTELLIEWTNHNS